MQQQNPARDGLSDRERARRARQRQESLAARLEPLGVSIADAAAMTSESVWKVKDRLRRSEYTAKKAGRRTLVVYRWTRKVATRFAA
jgi:hypothetical protein